MSALLRNLLHFAGLLRSLGLDVPAGRMPDVTAALAHVDLGRRQDVYFTLRSLLVHRQQDLAPFDEAFRVFWRPPPDDWTPNDLRALGEKRRFGPPQVEPAVTPSSPAEASLPTLPERIERVVPMSHSPSEATRLKDFAHFTTAEMEEARQAIARFEWSLDTRRTRRWTAGKGPAADLRRVVRSNLRYGGELVSIPSRERRIARRPLVLLCDVSGSMERYARILLHFAHVLTRDLDRVEAFLFATRLTRVTHDLARHGVDRALAAVNGASPTGVAALESATRFGASTCTGPGVFSGTDRFATLPGGLHLNGTPEQLADLIETWWRAGACDGVTLQPLRLPADAALFVDHVVPLLQARGVTRREYGEGTLRDQLELRRPPDQSPQPVALAG